MEAVAKKDLVQSLNAKLGVPVGQGGRLVDALVDSLKEALLKGNQVVIPDFHDEMLANLEAATEFSTRINGGRG